jgi:phosphoribosylformimino-5-aminoimidazole carboxamide ribotide isomerase
MRFRPCIDLRKGRVVQIVGGTLRDDSTQGPVTNFESERSAADYARLYQKDDLAGGHVICLGPGNEEAALAALRAFPGGLQMGGGVTPDNAGNYLDAGASHVIVTSYVFRDGQVDMSRLTRIVETVGKNRLVLDLSCRIRDGHFWVVTDRWQNFTNVRLHEDTLTWLSQYCDEFLVHGVDVEGKRMGIDAALVEILGKYSPVPATYAGGAKSLNDLDLVRTIGRNRVDLTIGSALDLFGGDVPYSDVVAWHRANYRRQYNDESAHKRVMNRGLQGE